MSRGAVPTRPPGVLAAPLRAEAIALRAGLRNVRQRPPVLRTGAGPVPAGSRRVAELDGPVIIAGVCGALVDGLEPGDLVVASEVIGPDGRRLISPGAALLVGSLRGAGLRVHLGPVTSVPAVVHRATERAQLATSGAIAVDVESAALLASCGDRPAAVVRAVVDTPRQALRHPGTVVRGSQALRSLMRAAPVLAAWVQLPVAEVLLASPRAFCAGVERAIATVEGVLDRAPHPVYVRRQIVHNTHVVADLESRGAVFVTELDEVPHGATVVLAAHGVAPGVRAQARGRSLQVVDATCPLVAKVHTEARRAAERGDVLVVIGHAEHEEVIGTVGEAPDRTVVVATPDEVDALDLPPGSRVTYLMQTTLAVEAAAAVVRRLLARYPEAQGPPTQDICYATTNRQAAVRAVARQVDVLLVLGSENSSNSRRLVEVARGCGVPAFLAEDTSAVRLEWLAGARRVGVTAGASAPPPLVDQIVAALTTGRGARVRTESVGAEDVVFELPKEVRQQ